MHYYNWDENIINQLCTYTGVFPATIEIIEKFAEILLSDMRQIDVWGQFYSVDSYFNNELSRAKKISLFNIEPFIHQDPWSYALKDKNVLIIHPFDKSILSQYKKRQFLFQDKRILPDFNLITFKAVQTLSGNSGGFKNWIEALEFMKNGVEDIDFDIAIIGCGAYGLPLAAHIKRMGKQSIHLGGSTQILFGIIGSRWENHPRYKHFINNYWVKPHADETPQNYLKIENGCYW
jgi:hypothetical protein